MKYELLNPTTFESRYKFSLGGGAYYVILCEIRILFLISYAYLSSTFISNAEISNDIIYIYILLFSKHFQFKMHGAKGNKWLG